MDKRKKTGENVQSFSEKIQLKFVTAQKAGGIPRLRRNTTSFLRMYLKFIFIKYKRIQPYCKKGKYEISDKIVD